MRGRALAALLAAAAALALALAPAARAAAPPVSATAAIVVDGRTGEVLYAKRPDRRRSIASTTKLMTALLVLERERLSSTVTATAYRASSVESQMGLRAGERLTVADLMRGLLLPSANDAAATLAQAVSGSRRRFVAAMNDRARELGLTRTHFANPVGLDERGNFSTARDLATLTRALRRNTFFKRTVNRASVKLESGDQPRTLVNRNDLVRSVPWMTGVKTGHTLKAGYVLVGSGRSGKGVTLVSVVLGTPSEAARDRDTRALLRWGFSQYTSAVIARRGRVVAQVPIAYRRGAELPVVLGRSVRRPVRRNRPNPYSLRLRSVSVEVRGPIRRGQRLGTADILEGGRRVTSVPVVAAGAVPAAGLPQRLQDAATKPWWVVLAAVALAGVLVLVGRRRRPRRPRPRSEPEAA
jgi:D-alanyl-D-alanine carboxypeptidase (penicillin-binding protein 5/6)